MRSEETVNRYDGDVMLTFRFYFVLLPLSSSLTHLLSSCLSLARVRTEIRLRAAERSTLVLFEPQKLQTWGPPGLSSCELLPVAISSLWLQPKRQTRQPKMHSSRNRLDFYSTYRKTTPRGLNVIATMLITKVSLWHERRRKILRLERLRLFEQSKGLRYFAKNYWSNVR